MRIRYLAKLSEFNRQLIILLAGVVAVGTIFGVWMLLGGASNVEWWKALGYPGVFLLSLLASGGMGFPIPGIAATCGAAGLSLNLIAVGILAGIGETIGELSGYAIGYGGQSILTGKRLYKRVQAWMTRWGILTLLVLAAVPNPIFDFVGISAGALRYPLRKFLLVVFFGKLFKGIFIAHLCYWIVRWVSWLD